MDLLKEQNKNIFKPVDNLLCNEDNASVISLEEFKDFDLVDLNEFRRKINLTRGDAAKDIMNSFPKLYKKIIQDMREENNLINKDLMDDMEEKVHEILSLKCKPKIKKIQENVDKIVAELNDVDYSEPTTESRMWKILEAEQDGKKFKATPPGYNVYNNEGKHWLDMPEIPWEIRNKSYVKCEEWLERQNRN